MIELEVEITTDDVANMAAMHESAARLLAFSKETYLEQHGLEAVLNWPAIEIRPGERFNFRIVNDGLQEPDSDAGRRVRDYLGRYEIDVRLREEIGERPLSTPILSLPINRASPGFASSVTLANFNEFDQKKAVDAATSRTQGSIIGLAIGRLATKFRLLLEKDKGGASKDFRADPQMQQLTSAIRQLGYDWRLVCESPLHNTYNVLLEKQGASFVVDDASSGEKELLTYIFAVYGLNVTNALIIVDEPELHLHPRWQAALLSLFEQLSRETGNQFLLATHSPAFISPASIRYVSRVYSERQCSRIKRLDDDNLPDRMHLFSIVNSQNNERIFFTDKVVLVEGISDRIFFERLLPRFKADGVVANFEIVSVGGKGFFEPYKKLLTACSVPHLVVADLDYAADVGPAEVKHLFSVSPDKIKAGVVDNPTSLDAAALVKRLDDAISNGNIEDLKSLWHYIKSRQLRLQPGQLEAGTVLSTFISESRRQGLVILSRGALEDYLPEGYRSKAVDKLISFLERDEFWDELPEQARVELEEIGRFLAS